jgi:hypothetical protein
MQNGLTTGRTVLSCSELKSFPAYRDDASTRILAPTHRRAPLNTHDPIMVKTVVRILVEKALKFPADASPEGHRLVLYTGQGAVELDDIAGEAIARVMDAGGEVLSCSSSDLAVHQKIVAGLRH